MFGVEMSGDKTSSAVLLRPMLPLMGMSFLVLEVSGRPSLFKTPFDQLRKLDGLLDKGKRIVLPLEETKPQKPDNWTNPSMGIHWHFHQKNIE